MLPLQHKKSPNLWLKKEWEHESPATRKASSGRKLIKMISNYAFCYWNVHLNHSLVQPVLCAKYICDQKPKNTPINVKHTRLFISQKIIGTCTTLSNSSQTEIPIFPTMHFFLHFYFFFCALRLSSATWVFWKTIPQWTQHNNIFYIITW